MTINPGEFVAIIGKSGSGKSTLMHILGCLDRPTSGEVYFKGNKVSNLSEAELAHIRNQEVGFVFQSFHLLSRATALKNVALPLTYCDLRQAKDKALKMLEEVGLADRADHFPNQLSGGEQQRVAIARALICNPTVIFADEPTGNLDTKSGRAVMNILKKLNRSGKTLVLVTHDPALAKEADRIIKIKDGQLV